MTSQNIAPLLQAIAAPEAIDMRLEDVEIRWSDDSAKQDPELICPRCDEAICDVEHGDSLGLLARTVLGHLNEECKK